MVPKTRYFVIKQFSKKSEQVPTKEVSCLVISDIPADNYINLTGEMDGNVIHNNTTASIGSNAYRERTGIFNR